MQAVRLQEDHNDEVASMLQLVVQHCPDLSTPADLCRLLQVSQSCRTALQQSTGHLDLSIGDMGTGLAELAHFCAWLPAHAGLVSHIDLSAMPSSSMLQLGMAEQHAACQLLLFALQACAMQQRLARVSAAPAEAAQQSGAGPQHEQQQQQQQQQAPPALQLRSYHSTRLNNAAVLEALNQQCAACLTDLKLWCLTPAQLTQRWFTALAALPALRKLEIGMHGREESETSDPTVDTLPSKFTSALAQLQNLAELTVDGFITPEGLQQLPTSVRCLTLMSSQKHAAYTASPVQLAPLQSLKRLELMTQEGLPDESMLPSALTALTVCGPASKVQGLAALQQLQLDKPYGSAQMLLLLPSLTRISKLTLAWLASFSPGHREVVAGLFDAVQSVTQLQELCLYQYCSTEEHWECIPLDIHGVSVHACLSKLPLLHALTIHAIGVSSRDALHFTSLTRLTRLTLCDCEVGDLAATAMACRLTNLRHLALHDCGLSEVGIWPVWAALPNLEFLSVNGHMGPPLTDDSLHLLTVLTRLTCLEVPDNYYEVSGQGRSTFLAAMPQLGGRLL